MQLSNYFYVGLLIKYVLYVFTGSPRLTGTGTVTVLVVDDNDNSPQFQYAQYTAHIQENQPAGTELLHVYATDRDDGRNADIRYVTVCDIRYVTICDIRYVTVCDIR